MDTDLLGLAFAAGMVAAFNPCGFAMLPAYLTLVIGPERRGPLAALTRAVLAAAAMAVGFVGVFGIFGLLTVSVASTVQRYLPYTTMVLGALLVVLGVWLLSGRELPGRIPGGSARWAPTSRLGSMVGYGIGFALASLSCTIGPFLAVTGSSLRSGSAAGTVAVYLAYAAGITLVVGALAVAVAVASAGTIQRARRALRYVNPAAGVVLVATGLYVAYYGWYEIRVLSGAGAADPVISAAGRLQGTLAGWVYRNGAWPWLVALGLAVAAAALAWTAARARRRQRRNQDEQRPAVASAVDSGG